MAVMSGSRGSWAGMNVVMRCTCLDAETVHWQQDKVSRPSKGWDFLDILMLTNAAVLSPGKDLASLGSYTPG